MTSSESDRKSQTLDQLFRWLHDYANQRINFHLSDQRRCIPPYVLLDFGKMGLMGLTCDRESGGLALSTSQAMRLIEYVAAIDLSLAVLLTIQNFLAGHPLRKHGLSALQDEYLEDIASGRSLLSFALTEDNAGSDPRKLETLAIETESGSWTINGSKNWAGMAGWSTGIVTFARSIDFLGNSGYTAFFVPQDLAGVRQREERMTMGLRSIVQNRVLFENVNLSEKYILGRVGDGLKVAYEAMMLCRIAMGSLSLGAMRRAMHITTRYITSRQIATGRMIDNPAVSRLFREQILRLKTAENFQNFVYRSLDNCDSLSDYLLLTCKIILPELMWKNIDNSMQLLGSRGYDEANGLARLFRDARVIRIFEGPTEVLASHLGGLVAMRPDLILNLLRDGLGSPEITSLFENALDVISTGAGRLRLDRRSRHRLRYQLGLAAAHAIFSGVNCARKQDEEICDPMNAEAYALSLFENQLRLFRLANSEPIVPSSLLETAASGFFKGLPDLETSILLENHSTDPLLRDNS